MKHALRQLSIVTLGLAVLAVARPASAGYSTETVYASFGSMSSELTTPITTNSTAFALFNSSLGTLESVTVVLQQTATVSSSVTNDSANTTNNYSVYSYDRIIATGLDGTKQGSRVTSNTVMGYIGTTSMLNNLGTVSNFSSSSHAVNATDLTPYIGSGTATMSVTGTTTTEGSITSGNPNPYLHFGGATEFYGTIQITYQYMPATTVPEPASLGLAAIGLGGIAIASRFRRRNKTKTRVA